MLFISESITTINKVTGVTARLPSNPASYKMFYCIYFVCICVRETHLATWEYVIACTVRSQDNLQESVLPFHHVSPRNQTQITRSGGKYLDPPNCLAGPHPVSCKWVLLNILVIYRTDCFLKKQQTYFQRVEGSLRESSLFSAKPTENQKGSRATSGLFSWPA